MFSRIGATASQGNRLGLVLDYDAGSGRYMVDFLDGGLEKTTHVKIEDSYPVDADVAMYRRWNRSDRLILNSNTGWDVVSNDDDLIWDQASKSYVHREESAPLRDYDPAWGLEPDGDITYVPSSPETMDSTDIGVFNQVVPKQDPGKYDNSFPSSGVTSSMEDSELVHRPTLGDCPTCGDPMNDNMAATESVCSGCGHSQPINYTIASRRAHYEKESAGALSLLEIAGEAAGSGAEDTGGVGITGILGQADDLISGAAQNAKGAGQGEESGQGLPSSAEQDLQNFHEKSSASDTDDEVSVSTPNSGHDVEPDAGNQGYTQDTGEGKEELKDVAEIGGTSEGDDAIKAFQALKPLLEQWRDDEDPHDNLIIRALDESLKKNFPEYKGLGHKRESSFQVVSIGEPTSPTGETKMCPVCHQDPSFLNRCPLGKESNGCPIFGNQNQQGAGGNPPPIGVGSSTPIQGFSSTQDETLADKIAARKPKMCPFHADLVDLALEIGDPASATNAMSRHMYSPNSCKGGWQGDDPRKPTKCRFKPAMIKQEYWDQREAEAEQRKLEREQQQLLHQPQVEVPQMQEDVVAPPVEENQPSAVQTEVEPTNDALPPQQPAEPRPPREPLPAPKPRPTNAIPVIDGSEPITQADVPDDGALETETDYFPENTLALVASMLRLGETGDSQIQEGRVYELYGMNGSGQEDVIPDIVRVTQVTPSNIGIVNLSGLGTQQSLPRDGLGVNFRLAPHDAHPNAQGQTTDNQRADDYTGPVADDLDNGNNSHAAKTAAVSSLSLYEQRELIEEQGEARNRDRLDLSETHYVI